MRSLAVDTTKDIKVPEFETLHITTPAPFVFNVELNRPAKRNAMNHTMWMYAFYLVFLFLFYLII